MDENTIDPNSLPPRRELFTQPSAAVVWAAICTLSTALQWEVMRELQERLGATDMLPSSQNAQRAILALREAAELLGRSPSVRDFEELREQNKQRRWPSVSTIRAALGGSWNHALGRAQLETVPDGDVVVLELGASFTGSELIDALRACRNDLSRVPSLTEYLGWARSPEVKRRPGRRPLSQGPFDRAFGGYMKALEAAELCDPETGAWNGARSTRVRAGVYSHTDEQLLDALREVAGRIGHAPRVVEYQAERERIIAESEAAGQLRTLPAYPTIQRRYGTLDAALVAAGLEPLGGRNTGTRPSRKGQPSPKLIPAAVILGTMRAAYAELGDPFTVAAYETWRKQKAKEDPFGQMRGRYPSRYTIWQRYGTWAAAVDAMRRADDGEDDDAAAAAVPA